MSRLVVLLYVAMVTSGCGARGECADIGPNLSGYEVETSFDDPWNGTRVRDALRATGIQNATSEPFQIQRIENRTIVVAHPRTRDGVLTAGRGTCQCASPPRDASPWTSETPPTLAVPPFMARPGRTG